MNNLGLIFPLLIFFNITVILSGQNLFIATPLSLIILYLSSIAGGIRTIIHQNYFKDILKTIDIKNRKESGDFTIQLDDDCDMDDINIIKSLTFGEKRIKNIQLIKNEIYIQWE